MNITGVTRTQGVYSPAMAKNAERISRANEEQDFVALSSKAKEFQIVRNDMANIPDVRAGKVADIANRIKAGTYDVSTRDIVDKMVKPIVS